MADHIANPAQYDAEKASEQFTVAVAADQNGKRLAVFADPMWATDQIVNYGLLGPGTAPMVGAAFPANPELFVNSMFWLSNMDEMIAASARSQDIRRIGDVTTAQMIGIRWTVLAGLPLAILMRSERLESICLTGMVTRIMLELLELICLPGMVTRMLLVGV